MKINIEDEYVPTRAENGKFVKVDSSNLESLGYPTSGYGKYAVLTKDISTLGDGDPSTINVLWDESYVPTRAENGKFVKLDSTDLESLGYPTSGYGKYALLTKSVDGFSVTDSRYVNVTGDVMTGNLYTPLLSSDEAYFTQLDAISANISYLDITVYELSGYEVNGPVVINDTLTVEDVTFTGEVCATSSFTNPLTAAEWLKIEYNNENRYIRLIK
jgi:hypothetical protein